MKSVQHLRRGCATVLQWRLKLDQTQIRRFLVNSRILQRYSMIANFANISKIRRFSSFSKLWRFFCIWKWTKDEDEDGSSDKNLQSFEDLWKFIARLLYNPFYKIAELLGKIFSKVEMIFRIIYLICKNCTTFK